MGKLDFNPDTLSSEDRALYNALVAKRKSKGAPFGGPYAALMNHPQLCEKIEALGFYLKFNGHLSRDVYQFVVLAVAKETGSEFEWQDHLHHATLSGLPQNVIEELRLRGIKEAEYPEPYKQAAHILKATLNFQNIPDKVQQEAISRYGMQGFIEVVVLSGFYQMFSQINSAFEVKPGS